MISVGFAPDVLRWVVNEERPLLWCEVGRVRCGDVGTFCDVCVQDVPGEQAIDDLLDVSVRG
jgi:hypothetical protein